jgi:hypothetical protein
MSRIEYRAKSVLKIWIIESEKSFVVDLRLDIPVNTQKNILRMFEKNSRIIINKWVDYIGEFRFIC